MKQQQGFTLLEMLVAFSLVSLLFLALFASFNTIGRSWEAAETRMNKTADMRLITDFLRRQLSQAMVVKIKNEDGAAVYAFEGTESLVRYAAPLQPLQHQGGVFLVQLSVESSVNGKMLEMLYAPYRPELTWDEAFEDSEPVLVFDGLKTADFEYFGSENLSADDPEWQSSWEDQLLYPQMLKLNLEDGERGWPALFIDLPQASDYAK